MIGFIQNYFIGGLGVPLIPKSAWMYEAVAWISRILAQELFLLDYFWMCNSACPGLTIHEAVAGAL